MTCTCIHAVHVYRTYIYTFAPAAGILNNASEEHNELRPNGDYLFQFDWSSIAKNSNSDLSKGVIRAHFRSQSKSNRTESVSVVMAANVSVGILDDDAPAVPSGGTRFTASGNGSGWIEIEITAGLKAAWYRSNASAVVVSIHLSREDGVTAGGVSVVITDPSAIPLDLRHQNRYAALQPLLLIYLEDGSLKTRAMVLSTGPRIDGTMQEAARARRSDLVGSCGLYNYTVTFSDVGIDFVLTPESMNIGRCSGGCATSNQRSMPAGTVTNHASVIAAADAVQRTSESSSSGQGGVACCFPLKYQPVYLLVFNSDMILRVQLFTDMVVSTCGCG